MPFKQDNLIQIKTFDFALAVIKLYKQCKSQNEFVISKQLLRAGTSIGANVEEGIAAQSKRDFMSKLSIANKEAGDKILVETSKSIRFNTSQFRYLFI